MRHLITLIALLAAGQTVILLESEIPAHSHTLRAYRSDPADRFQPTGAVLARTNNGNAPAAAQR
jgi:microcystin-dependent protein